MPEPTFGGPPDHGFERVPPGPLTPEQQRASEAVSTLVGFFEPHFRGGFLYGAIGDDETENTRRWTSWELTDDLHGNLGLAVIIPDVISALVNSHFRATAEEQAEDAKRLREDPGYFTGCSHRIPASPPLGVDQLFRAMASATVNLAEWLSAYLLVGHIVTEFGRAVPIARVNIPPGASPIHYWQGVMIAVDYAQWLFLSRHGFRPTSSVTVRVCAELLDVVDLRPAALRALMGEPG